MPWLPLSKSERQQIEMQVKREREERKQVEDMHNEFRAFMKEMLAETKAVNAKLDKLLESR